MRRVTLASLLALSVGPCVVAACVGQPPWQVGRAPAAAPIPASGEAWAVSDDIVKRKAWYERNFLEGYRRAGRHDAKCDAKTEEFVRLNADPFVGIPPDESADMQGRARTLVASGCDDPVVLLLAAG